MEAGGVTWVRGGPGSLRAALSSLRPGDFAMLLQAGLSFRQLLLLSLVSGVLGLGGAALGVGLSLGPVPLTPWVFGVTAGVFLYVALVDMVRGGGEQRNRGRRALGAARRVAGAGAEPGSPASEMRAGAGRKQGAFLTPDVLLSFQLPALLRPPEPLPRLHMLLQGLGLLLGGALMLTIALLEEQLWPLVSDD